MATTDCIKPFREGISTKEKKIGFVVIKCRDEQNHRCVVFITLIVSLGLSICPNKGRDYNGGFQTT